MIKLFRVLCTSAHTQRYLVWMSCHGGAPRSQIFICLFTSRHPLTTGVTCLLLCSLSVSVPLSWSDSWWSPISLSPSLNSIGLNGKFLRFRRDGVRISYTAIYLSHFDVCLAIHKLCKQWKLYNWLNIVNIFKKNYCLFVWKRQKLSVQPNT
jgi:hypothetical protein